MRRVLCGLIVAGAVVSASGAEAPWTLDRSTADRAKDLLPEPILERVRRGDYVFPVVPADPATMRDNYSRAFWDASARNAGKYDLDPSTCGLRDVSTGHVPAFYFGLPFPKIERSDERAGCKIAWNATSVSYMAGGSGGTFYLIGLNRDGAYRTVRTTVRAAAYVGHHGAPTANPDKVVAKATTIALEPVDIEGVSTLTVRYPDWDRKDDMWAYVPQTRRARRIHAAARSEPIAGMDIFADDINCYAGKVEGYTWRLTGEGQILAPLVGQPAALPMRSVTPTRWAIDTPAFPAAFEQGGKGHRAPWLIEGGLVFVPRPVWILEGESPDPYYQLGKVTFFVDRELYRIYWKLVTNRAGEYFYNAMCGYTFGKTPDGALSAVLPTLVVGVNDRTDRAAIGGRSTEQFVEHAFPPEDFTLKAITRSSD